MFFGYTSCLTWCCNFILNSTLYFVTVRLCRQHNTLSEKSTRCLVVKDARAAGATILMRQSPTLFRPRPEGLINSPFSADSVPANAWPTHSAPLTPARPPTPASGCTRKLRPRCRVIICAKRQLERMAHALDSEERREPAHVD